jgi:hydrogenase maturation protease
MKKILIAGIGNIFNGDDAFGCEVIREIPAGAFPATVAVIDYGIRSYDLAYALTSDYDAIVLVDATSRGKESGTLYLIEPDIKRLDEIERVAVDAHSMNPVSVIHMAQSIGGVKGKLYLVGCEPAVLESDEGQMGLSMQVQAAVPQALEMIATLVKEILEEKEKIVDCMANAGKENYEYNVNHPWSDRSNHRCRGHLDDSGTASLF